jgi:branched-chain amino acid aminotransferase
MPESGRQDAQSINKSKIMSRNIWLDGKIVDESDAKISVFDHGLLYGDGIFEGIRFYNGRVFRLTEHIERLYLSAKALLLKMPWTLEEVCEATLQTIRANNLNDGYIRLVVTRGIGDLGLNPYLCPNPSMFIIASGITLYPAELYENGLEVVTCSTRRPTPASLSPQVKSLNYLNNVMAKVEALKAGAKEGLMLNEQGYVAECTGDNVFVVKKGEVITPPVSDGSLDGITRQVIFELCFELGISIREMSMARYDIYTADESFLTGTAAETIPMVKLDEREIGDGKPGPISLRLIEAYRQKVRSEGTLF